MACRDSFLMAQWTNTREPSTNSEAPGGGVSRNGDLVSEITSGAVHRSGWKGIRFGGDGVRVGDGVAVRVGLGVGVRVRVGVGVRVAVRVGVRVGLGEGVGVSTRVATT